MDMMRDDLAAHTDAGLDHEPTSHQKFLLEEGLEVLALYRSIGDPDVRLMVRRLLGAVSGDRTREQ